MITLAIVGAAAPLAVAYAVTRDAAARATARKEDR